MVSQSQDQQQASSQEERDRPMHDVGGHSGHDDDDGNDSIIATAGSQQSALISQASSRAASPRITHRTRAQVRRVQIHQREHDQPVLSADEILRSEDSMFRGLTPPPWPSDLTPHKKRPRTVEEIIKDDSPRDPDKMHDELEQMIENTQRKKMKLPSHPRRSEAGPSNGATTEKRR
ncbi:hypothetical protein SUNI508_00389 [Seiridium unicorne]|uniref:Uncharacterized protein n=1 Tax=Seiridium unicorne TaxID=138068 RepID=A0ABR2V6Y9_9PEZI